MGSASRPAAQSVYIYHGCDGDPASEFDLEICLPMPAALAARVQRPIELKSTPPFQCFAAEYVGPMSGIGKAWMELVQEVKASGRRPTEQSREIYKKWVGFDWRRTSRNSSKGSPELLNSRNPNQEASSE